MSVEIAYFLVRWKRLASPANLWDDDGGLFPALGYVFPDIPPLFYLQREFLDHLQAGSAPPPLQAFFQRLFWSWTNETPQTKDPPLEEEEDLEIALSPSTTRDWYQTWPGVPLEGWTRTFRPSPVFPDPTALAHYGNLYLPLFRTALEEGQGIIGRVYG